MCQFPDMEITLDNFANHLFPASLKALSFLERFYPCSQQNARNKVFFYFKLAVKMHMYYREIKKQNLMHVFQSVTWEHKTTFWRGKYHLVLLTSPLCFFFHFSLKSLRAKTWISNANSCFGFQSWLKNTGWGEQRKWQLIFKFNKEDKKRVWKFSYVSLSKTILNLPLLKP